METASSAVLDSHQHHRRCHLCPSPPCKPRPFTEVFPLMSATAYSALLVRFVCQRSARGSDSGKVLLLLRWFLVSIINDVIGSLLSLQA